MPSQAKLIKTLQEAWRREKQSAETYRQLANRDADGEKQKVLLKLAEAEERHAEKWEKRLKELGSKPPKQVERLSDRIRRWLLIRTGTDNALRRLEEEEDRVSQEYEETSGLEESPVDRDEMLKVQKEERVHSKVLQSMTPAAGVQGRLQSILSQEKWHTRGAGGWIGQAIYGANDGLGAVFGIVSGMAGYTGGSEVVLISGLAGMLASALSMGSGAYLATKSEREVYEAEMERERKEIEENPEEELEELELFYQLKGFTREESSLLAKRLLDKPEQFLKALAHEELGLSEATFPNPWKASLSASLSTAFGGLIPIIPFFFTSGMPALIASIIISTVAHFVIGASKTIVTGRSWLASGTEMTIVGIIEAAVTYGLGLLFSPK